MILEDGAPAMAGEFVGTQTVVCGLSPSAAGPRSQTSAR